MPVFCLIIVIISHPLHIPEEVPHSPGLVVPNDSFPPEIHDKDTNYGKLIAGFVESNNAKFQILFRIGHT